MHALDDARAHHPARARDGAARAEEHARVVEELGLAQEPQRIGRANPAGVEVLGVAVARGDEIARVEGLVHLGHVGGAQQIVGVEDEEGLVLTRVLVEHTVEAIVEHPALALAREVVALVDDGPGAAGLLGGVVRAGVGHHEGVDELRRVVLLLDGAHEVGYDALLVVRRDEEGVAVVAPGLGEANRAAPQRHEDVDELIEVREREERPHDEVEDDDGREAQAVELHGRPFHVRSCRGGGARGDALGRWLAEQPGHDLVARPRAAHGAAIQRF